MTLPTIVPVAFQATAKDFLHTKCSRDGDMSLQVQQVSIPSGTTTTTIVGLIPFNKGIRVATDAFSVLNDALGTSVTISLGYVYNDNVSFTNNQTAFLAATAAASAGLLAPTGIGLDFVAQGDGWIVATVGGATTTTTGNLTASVPFAYDGVNATN